MTFGQAAVGVAPSLLLAQRRAAASVLQPTAAGDLDLALMIADDGGAAADPAHIAFSGPICGWAAAVWDHWFPHEVLDRLLAAGRRHLHCAARPWSRVRGPVTAFIATTADLGWQIQSATALADDQGLAVDLRFDPPGLIRQLVVASVYRWRWKRVACRLPSLRASPWCASFIQPIRHLLGGRSRGPDWTSACAAALRSLVLDRQ